MVNKAVVEAAKPNPEGTVFISYRRDDGKEYANEIGALLRAVGLVVPQRHWKRCWAGKRLGECSLSQKTYAKAI